MSSIVWADEVAPGPPLTYASFMFNGEEDNVTFSAATSSVEITISTPEEVYFTRLYVCSEEDVCDGSSYTKRFDINATSTAFSRTWDGSDFDDQPAPAGDYLVLVRYYRYSLSQEPIEEYAPMDIVIVSDAQEEQEKEEDVPEVKTVPNITFLINSTSTNATVHTGELPVSIAASSSEEVYFESLYICLDGGDSCTADTSTVSLGINATSTDFMLSWNGRTEGAGDVQTGTYTFAAQYRAYAVSPEARYATTSLSVTLTEPPPPQTLIDSPVLTAEQTWTKEGSPYVIEGTVSMQQYRPLTIEAGVVVKFKEGAKLKAHARSAVTIEGTIEEPVIFTSFKDDSLGGDTNNDGDTTSPAPGDWGYADFGSGSWNNELDISHLKVRYGGGVSIDAYKDTGLKPELLIWYPWFNRSAGVEYELHNIEALHSAGEGLVVYVGKKNSLTVTGSSFHSNELYGVRKITDTGSRSRDFTGHLALSGNWWGTESGPYHNTLNPEGDGNAITGTKITLDSWLSSDPFYVPERYDCCSSVLFLPGLQGSVLKLGTNELWPPTYGDVSDDLGTLSFEDGAPMVDGVVVDGIINSFYGQEVYQGFTDFMNRQVTIDDDTGTSTLKEWKPFAYDWRYAPDDIVTRDTETPTGEENIIDVLETLAENSYTRKVTIVAHSYGGLVGKELIKKLEAEGKAGLVDAFIMAGSPQLGTPQAIAGLLHGEGSDLGDDFSILGFMPFKLVTKNRARTLAGTLPSAHHLLPSEQFFEMVPDPVVTFTEPNSAFEASRLVGKWHAAYGAGVSDFDDMTNFLTAAFVPRSEASNNFKNPNVLNDDLIANAAVWHREHDSFAFPEAMRVVEVAGWGLPTIKGVGYRYRKSVDDTQDEEGNDVFKLHLTTEGDFAVVYPSAVASSDDEFYYFKLDSYSDEEEKTQHSNMINAAPFLNLFTDILKGRSASENAYIKETKPIPATEDEKLIVSAHSPVTLGVTDDSGNYTGITLGQDPAADILTITTDIPGSSYFSVGDAQYIVLPDSGQYTFVMDGTGEGEVTVIIETLAGGDEQTTIATYDFAVSQSSKANFTIAGATPSAIALDQDGDGAEDESVLSEEMQAEQEKIREESQVEAVTSAPAAPPAPKPVGGGPLWNSVQPQPQVLGAATTAMTLTLETTLAVKQEEAHAGPKETFTPSTPVRYIPEPVQEVQLVATKEQEPGARFVPTPSPTVPQQAASAVQSGWYDRFISFITNLVQKILSFFRSLF